jgi:hypothetical protein
MGTNQVFSFLIHVFAFAEVLINQLRYLYVFIQLLP